MESATPTGVLPSVGKTDWDSIEKQYRAGVFSIREIASQHGISDTAIRKKAKACGWERDLTERVQELVRTEVRSSHEEQLRTEEIINTAVFTQIQVVREHRLSIRAGQQMVGRLLGRLQRAPENLEDLPTHAGVIKDLANAMHKLVGLERQAFGLADKTDPDPPAKPQESQEVEDVDYTELRQAFEKRLGHAATAA